MERGKAQEIIRQFLLEIKTENAFQEAWPGEKPSWVTAPTVVLLKLAQRHIEVVDCDKPTDKTNSTRTNADLLLALGEDLFEKEEPSHIPEHFIKTSSSRALESTKADLEHIKNQYRHPGDLR